MTSTENSAARCAVIVGPYTSGKTTLLEAILHTAGAIGRKGRISEKNTVGDGSEEARDHQMSVEPNFAHCEYLGDKWHFIDCPGSVELVADRNNALMAADIAIVVVEPEETKALILAPLMKYLEEYDIPHLLFVNKMDKSTVRMRDLLSALQAVSHKPLVLRQVPIRDGDNVTGFVDLASERAYRYVENKHSDLIEMPEDIREREGEARQEMLESLADFDDELLEQLLEDKVPANEEVFAQLTKDLQEDLIVPVLLGSAESGYGITRLLKALRHEAPGPDVTAKRLGIAPKGSFTGSVIRIQHQAHTGKMTVARLWSGKLTDGATVGEPDPAT
jgi:elongation factor G